jgi:hypothetical protein
MERMSTHLRSISFAAFVVSMLTPVSAFAQEAGKMGIMLSTPATVGLFFQVTERVAVRPEFGFSTTSSDNNVVTGSTTLSNYTITPGVSVNYYIGKFEALRTYVSGRYAFQRNKSTVTPPPPATPNESWTNSQLLSGALGADYLIHGRFSVFAELGLALTHSSSHAPAVTVVPTSNSWGLRSVVGGVLYF